MRCPLSLVLVALVALPACWRSSAAPEPAVTQPAAPAPGSDAATMSDASVDAALSGGVGSPAALRAYVGACEQAGPDALDRLRELADREDPMVASHALRALGRVSGGTDAALVARLADTRPAVRQAAIAGLGMAGNEAALTHLDPLIQDPDPTVRRVAIVALGRIGGALATRRLDDLAATVRDAVDLAFVRSALAPADPIRVHRSTR